MEFGRESGFSNGNVVQVITGGNVGNWMSGAGDPALWATEDDYRVWNGDGSMENSSNSNYDGSEPPNKKSRNSQTVDSQGSGLGNNNRSKAIGKMFFKTKLCCKFRAGTCPYVTNCNFAHSIEELRRPPPNWQDIVAAHEEEKRGSEPREEFRIPSIDSSNFSGESSRSYKGRHCKKFYTEEGCPYGENCTFLHDEHSRSRESVAISLNPGPGGSYGASASPTGTNVKPSNWKTRICNKWEMTGYCPFGSKCHFAHGIDELHRYGGGPVEIEGKDSVSAPSDSKQSGVPSKTLGDVMVAAVTSVPHSDIYHIGVPSQRPSNTIQRPVQRTHQKWKGPDKISKIYGDWIDDIE